LRLQNSGFGISPQGFNATLFAIFLKIFDPLRQTLLAIPAHNGFIRGIGIAADGKSFFSCGADCTVKQWALDPDNFEAVAEKVLVSRADVCK